jgi:hypothetical protein
VLLLLPAEVLESVELVAGIAVELSAKDFTLTCKNVLGLALIAVVMMK